MDGYNFSEGAWWEYTLPEGRFRVAGWNPDGYFTIDNLGPLIPGYNRAKLALSICRHELEGVLPKDLAAIVYEYVL